MTSSEPTIRAYELSPEQRVAAQYTGGPLRIIAGAGTGKTSTLTARFVHLVREQNVPAHEILAVTFSSKAADEMRSRIVRDLGGNHRRLWIQTFHALCLRLLGEWARERGEPDPRVISDTERWQILTRAAESVPLAERHYYHLAHGTRAFARDLGAFTDRLQDDLRRDTPVGTDSPARLRDLDRGLHSYHALLQEAGAVDFGLLSSRVVLMLESDDALRERTCARFRHVLVDEFQDTNHAQFRLIELLVPEGDHICVVGDENQAIYAFRGGQSAYFGQFVERFRKAQSFSLTENYRSGEVILKAANNLVRHNKSSVQLELTAVQNDNRSIVTVTEETTAELEAEAVARRILAITSDQSKNLGFRDIAVLFRSVRTQAEPFRRAFRLYGIPFSQGPMTGLDYAIRHDILAAFRLVARGPNWTDAARLALGRGGTALGRQSLERHRSAAALLEVAQAPAPPDLSRHEHAFLEQVRLVLADAQAVTFATPAAALYSAMVLAGHVHEGTDPSQARHLGALVRRAMSMTTVDEVEVLLNGRAPEEDDIVPEDHLGVQMLTVHAAKGLEWPVVFVVGLAEGIFPIAPRQDRDQAMHALVEHGVNAASESGVPRTEFERDHYREERRLAYVAVTRAKRELHLSHAAVYGAEIRERSRFLAELGFPTAEAAGVDDEYVRLSSIFALGRDLRHRQRVAMQVLPTSEAASTALADLMLAQWAAGRVPGVNPIRERLLPNPYQDGDLITFSASDLEQYETCPRKYLYAALLRLDREDHGVHALLGTVVHTVMEQINRYRQEFGRIPTDDQVEAILDEAWPQVGFDLAVQSRQFRIRAGVMIRRYLAYERSLPPQRTPVWIERYARVDYTGHSLSGKVDLVMRNADGSFDILDYKTGRVDSYQKSRQLYLYWHIWTQVAEFDLTAPVRASLVSLRHDDDKGNRYAPAWKANQMKTVDLSQKWIADRRSETDQLLARILVNEFAGAPNQCERCQFRMVCPDGQ